ncbi:efflux RND transporter permease subunit, partial [Nostoc sp. 'Peltigera malacea cyanobiont' DB3992]|uniref:efflux RND transporter permease subunit n=1 Tax=Nostoc sp. 'Peltigera malacea cyanobiont' DB3992 TaxID=1206980 RepID=UPI00117CDD41
LPPELNLAFLFDQSIFVKASIQGVLKEGLIAACLTALMILIFLGSWRSTVIVAVSIPLSMLVSIIVMSRLGQTFNIMTLGGLSLAVGILVDDATVEIENIHRNLGQGKPIKRAILDGAQQIATPALVATLCICIVFVPVVFLSGVAKYLFVPLAMAVVFGMLASYVLSRTVVPTMASYLLPQEADWHRESENHNGHSDRHHLDSPVQNDNAHGDNHHIIDSPVQNNNGHSDNHHIDSLVQNNNGRDNHHQRSETTTKTAEPVKKDWIWRLHEKFNRQFEKFRSWYYDVLKSALNHRRIVFVLFGAFIVSAGVLLPFVGSRLFPGSRWWSV